MSRRRMKDLVELTLRRHYLVKFQDNDPLIDVMQKVSE
jgi:hypothetical protein